MIEYTKFKGHDMIMLKRDSEDKYPFSFGRSKAKLIADNIDAVVAFANSGEKKEKTEEDERGF